MANVVTKQKKSLGKLGLIGGLALLFVALAVFGGFYFKQYNNLKNNPKNAEQIAQEEVDQTIAEVGKLYDLPKDEKPNVATVQDKEKLKDQPFFAKAENGDVTLIYSGAKLAILYRPSEKRIINISSVVIEADKAKVKVIGDERITVEQKLIGDNLKDEVLLQTGGDAKSTPDQITVVDLAGSKGEIAKKIAEEVGGTVANLPEGEDKPADTDILIIMPASTPVTE